MKKIKKEIIRMVILLGIGYVSLYLMSLLENLLAFIPIPIQIIGICFIIYYILKNLIEGRL